jgi:hypothetical protein
VNSKDTIPPITCRDKAEEGEKIQEKRSKSKDTQKNEKRRKMCRMKKRK